LASSTPSPDPSASTSRGTRPVSLRIPSIDIDSQVEPVGTDDRVLQIPPEPWVVGWWRDGVGAGGGRGTVVMTAHLDSRRYGTGPFVRAKDLAVGSRMTMTDVNGAAHDYAVEAVDTFNKQALPYAELFTQRGPERVVLVTCGGTYNRDAGGWDSNVVVTFVPTGDGR
jgi:sortase (surface protein transpeptidase)